MLWSLRNNVERWFRELTDKRIRCGSFFSVEELAGYPRIPGRNGGQQSFGVKRLCNYRDVEVVQVILVIGIA
jgi:hypothetical protein